MYRFVPKSTIFLDKIMLNFALKKTIYNTELQQFCPSLNSTMASMKTDYYLIVILLFIEQLEIA